MNNGSAAGPVFDESALTFCNLVDQIDAYKTEVWLKAIGAVLLSLEAAIVDLILNADPTPHVWLSDLEKHFELYSRLRDFLGEHDEYWSEADLNAGDGYMTGSLSDDFADIYFELKRGLLLLAQGREGQQRAKSHWASSYRHHWRQHLVDARKQLFEFRNKSRNGG